MHSFWWFKTKGGFFFLFLNVLFLYLFCFWFCSRWLDLHMCCRQSSGLHAYTHMWCIYQQDPPWESACIPANKTALPVENVAYWHVSLQTNKKPNPTSNSAYPERGMLRRDANMWERGLFSWLLLASRFSAGEVLVLVGWSFSFEKHTHTHCSDCILNTCLVHILMMNQYMLLKAFGVFQWYRSRNNHMDHRK